MTEQNGKTVIIVERPGNNQLTRQIVSDFVSRAQQFEASYADKPLGEVVLRFQELLDDSNFKAYLQNDTERLAVEGLLVRKFKYTPEELAELKGK